MPAFIGHRIELHPATDRWMRGERFARVLSIRRRRASGPLWLRCVGERSGQRFWLHPSNVLSTIIERGV